ncbi:acyloxyacyl hydrolase [Pelagibacterium sediminicola]|uniref:acyloxyacyl hydrolase n=1 Tax=Pelagibacterium sediminicola TaxID=2248761 RepID=UPI0013004704|nr:acyloxyacyl hydrolase [Pelagibacterium sediminicola]
MAAGTKSIAGALFALALAAAPAMGQALVLDEVRGGVFAHNAYHGFIPTSLAYDFSRIENVKFSALFTAPALDDAWWLLSPRLELGGTFNLAGRRENLVHANLSWQFGLFETPLYLELGLGAGLTDGALSGAVAPARNFGCPLNFYESAGIGAHITETMTATLVYEHMSNLGICTPNEGISHVGVQLGWKF